MKRLEPAPGVHAFYSGRDPGERFAPGENWVDDGALELGIAVYAIVDGDEALVYDTHVSVAAAREIRAHVEALGANRITVLLSHHHLDHVAGTEAFADCEILAGARTAAHLERDRAAIENGTLEGPPAIDPLVMPTRTLEDTETLTVGARTLELLQVDIHSDDATVVWMPEEGLLLAGDTMEDTVTYVGEPEGFERHLADLERLNDLEPSRILPNHGNPEVIAGGGYNRGLIRATQQYIRALERMREDPELRDAPLQDVIAGPLGARWITWFEPYERVHRSNVRAVLGV